MNTYHNFKRQHGVALITAIMVLALAVIAATAISSDYQLFARRVENSVFGSQAWAYQYASEQWAIVVLRRDKLADGPQQADIYDHPSEDWGLGLSSQILPAGELSASLSDEQAKLNINNLLTDDGVDAIYKQRMQRLFSLLEINPNIVNAIIDWIDPNITPTQPEGAEDQYYIGLERPYLSAGQLMYDISELKLIRGIEAEDYLKLKKYVTALPMRTELNLNAISAQVMAAIVPNMSVELAQDLITNRDMEPYQHIQDFISQVVLNNLQLDPTGLSVKSEFFTLSSEINIAKNYSKKISLMHRMDTQVKVVKRITGQ